MSETANNIILAFLPRLWTGPKEITDIQCLKIHPNEGITFIMEPSGSFKMTPNIFYA